MGICTGNNGITLPSTKLLIVGVRFMRTKRRSADTTGMTRERRAHRESDVLRLEDDLRRVQAGTVQDRDRGDAGVDELSSPTR